MHCRCLPPAVRPFSPMTKYPFPMPPPRSSPSFSHSSPSFPHPPPTPLRPHPPPLGQEDDARDLHSNFTAAWHTFGWLPELFGFDLGGVNSADGGYNLRPEHVESTFMLHTITRDPHYITVAASIMDAIGHCRTRCGYTRIASVESGGGLGFGLEGRWEV